MLDEDLRKKMGEAFEKGNYSKALKLSQQLDKQILKYTRYELPLTGQNTKTYKCLQGLTN